MGGYVDSLSVPIPGQTASLGLAEFGPKISYTLKANNRLLTMPSLSIKGLWKFAEDNSAVLAGTAVGAADFRGKAEAGLKIVNKKAGRFLLSAPMTASATKISKPTAVPCNCACH